MQTKQAKGDMKGGRLNKACHELRFTLNEMLLNLAQSRQGGGVVDAKREEIVRTRQRRRLGLTASSKAFPVFKFVRTGV